MNGRTGCECRLILRIFQADLLEIVHKPMMKFQSENAPPKDSWCNAAPRSHSSGKNFLMAYRYSCCDYARLLLTCTLTSIKKTWLFYCTSGVSAPFRWNPLIFACPARIWTYCPKARRQLSCLRKSPIQPETDSNGINSPSAFSCMRMI